MFYIVISDNLLKMTLSVIIPTYNRSTLILKTLDSVFKQQTSFDEVIIVDDASTDNTLAVLNEYIAARPNVQVIKLDKNSGAQYARNAGIKLSSSDFVILLDSDNTLSPKFVEQVKAKLTENPQVDIVTNFSQIIDETGNFGRDKFEWITKDDILAELLNEKTYVDNSSACIRRQKLLDIGLLDEYCPSFQEWDTHIRLAQVCSYDYIPEYLTNYYVHSGERISVSTKTILAKGLYVLKKHKKLWYKMVGRDVYQRLVIHAYDTIKSNSNVFFSFKVFIAIMRFYPRIGVVTVKRFLNSNGK